MQASLPDDGLEALRSQIGVHEIASLIERTARWVDPATFRLLPVWYPEFGRRQSLYKADWLLPRTNTRRGTGIPTHKIEGNTHANKALTCALGLRSGKRPHWSCCHIWGVDDPTYQRSNDVVQNARFYSCVGNMVLLPSPLKAFTDTMPEIKAMLRLCARNLYGWSCDHEAIASVHLELNDWDDWGAYPLSWPRTFGEKEPLGLVRLTPFIKDRASKRLERIRHDLKQAGPLYPREQVREVLRYWSIEEAPS